ncbi:MAG: hypothetical protein ABIG28_01700 [archaeon]
MERKLKGFKGWLLVYVLFFSLVVLEGIINLVFFGQYRLFFRDYLIENEIYLLNFLVAFSGVFLIILFIISLVFILKRDQKALLWSNIFLVFGLLNLLFGFIYSFYLRGFVFDELRFFYFISALVVYVGYLFYWNMSERVKNTFVK